MSPPKFCCCFESALLILVQTQSITGDNVLLSIDLHKSGNWYESLSSLKCTTHFSSVKAHCVYDTVIDVDTVIKVELFFRSGPYQNIFVLLNCSMMFLGIELQTIT